LQVRQGEKVFFNDTLLFGIDAADAATTKFRARSIPLNFHTIRPSSPAMYDTVEKPEDLGQVTSEFTVEASTAEFGIDVDKARWISSENSSIDSFGLAGAELIRIPENPLGCSPYNQDLYNVTNKMIYVERGDCLFIEKLAHARKAGALGVIVWNEDEELIRPTADPNDLRKYNKDIEGGAVLVVPGSAHSIITNRLTLAEQDPVNNIVRVRLEKEWPDELVENRLSLKTEPSKTKPTPGRILYVNGHAMINTEILF
jgi:ER degradation enhancer, mannosidase alpha-like 1